MSDMTTRMYQSNRLRRHRSREPNGIFSVNKCLDPRLPVLGDSQRKLVVSALEYSVAHCRVEIGAYVVLPDHFHVLAGLLGGWTLDGWMQTVMSFVGAKTGPALKADGCRWQDGYHDKKVRSLRQFNYLIDYIHWNPVRAGLVTAPEEWPESSSHTPDWVRLSWW